MPSGEVLLAKKTVVTYAVGSVGTGGFATLPGLVLVYYLTDSLGIAAIAAGVIVTLAKVWDVIIDPVIGARSDRSLAVTGSRHRFMVLGASALPLLFALTFAVPAGLDPVIAGTWVFIAFVLTATAFSLFQVPFIALPAELTAGYDQRTRLLSMRVVVLTIAILLFGAGGPALRKAGDNEYAGYLIMAIVAGLVIGAGMYVASSVAPRSVRPGVPVGGHPPVASIAANYRAGFAVLRRSQPFRVLLITFLLQALATGVMLADAQYVATWVMHSEDAVTLLFVALIAPAVIFAPVWGRIAGRVGKERAFVYASVLFAVAALSMVALIWAPGDWVYLPVALAGAGFAGMQSLPLSMLPDVIAHDASTHGEGVAGTFGGVWTAGETTGAALGATLLTIVLSLTGYLASSGSQVVEQSPAAVAGIVLSFSVLPAVILAVSLATLARYPLRKSDIDVVAGAIA